MNIIPRRNNESIKKFVEKYFNLIKNFKEDDCCGICLNNYQQGELISSLNCSEVQKELAMRQGQAIQNSSVNTVHNFHQKCILEWFNKKLECPNCRTNYKNTYNDFIN